MKSIKKLSLLMFLVIGLVFSAVFLFKVSTSAYAITLQCQDSSECIKAYPSPPMFCSDGATMQYRGACEDGECNYKHYWVVPGNPWGCMPKDSATPTPTSTDCNFTGCDPGYDCFNGSCVILTTPPPTSGDTGCSIDADCSGGTACRPAACNPNYVGEGCGFFNMPAGSSCGSGQICDGNGSCVTSGSGTGDNSGPSCGPLTCLYTEAVSTSQCSTGVQWVVGTGCTGNFCTPCNYVVPGTCSGNPSSTGCCQPGECGTPPTSGGTPVPTVTKSPTPVSGSGGSACSGNTCNDCVLNNRPDVLTFYKNNGWDTSCSNQAKIVQDWCGIDPAGCSGIKSGTCSSSCGGGGGGGACTVTNWSFSNSNPPPNTLIKATVKGVSDPGGWQNVVYKQETDSSWVHPPITVSDGPTFSFDVNSGTNGNHAVTLGTSNGATTCSPTGSFTTGGTPTSTATPTPTTKTTHYRLSQTKFDKADTVIAWQPYSSEPTTVPVVFTNLVAGQDLTVFVQFKADDGSTSEVLSKSIKYSPPVDISSVACNFDPSGTGTLATLTGNNFGVQGQGQVSISGQAADIISWTMQKIVAKVAGKPTASAKIQIGLKTDGMSQPMISSCQLDTSSVDFVAKIGCRASGDFTVNDVDVTITEATTGAKPQVKEKIQLDQSGHLVNFSPVLEASKKYWMLLKAPKSVTQKVEFVSSEGSVVLPDMKLPIGNIAPQGDPDTQINSFDKSELVKQWSLTTDVQRTGDLNMDGRVNSIDWSCMRADFNKEDQI